jgi:lipid-binding SYLF domain-containing protein
MIMRRHRVGTTGVLAKLLAMGLAIGLSGTGGVPTALASGTPAERVDTAREVYRELMKSPDHSVPAGLLKECKGIAIFPHVVKGAFMFGARYGKGIVCCRDSGGRWSPPAFFTLVGGSVGWQIGAEATDVVLVFMTTRGTQSLLSSEFTLGGNLSVAAGPIGRSAEAGTDLKFNAEIYSYALSKGVFAGISLEGARVSVDGASAESCYGAPVQARAILFEHHVPRRPPEVDKLVRALP